MVLARKEFDATNEAGDLLTDVQVRVEREGGGLVSVYSDRDGATPLGNPFTVMDGRVAFHAAGGAHKITLTAGGYSRVLRYVAIGLAAEIDLSTIQLVPAGGTEGQVLKKASDDDNDTEWGDAPGNSTGFATVSLLLADTTLSYSVLLAGDIVEAQGFRYQVAEEGASDADLVTAGGLKLNILRGPDGRYALSALGVPQGGNIAAKLQAFLNKIRLSGFRESVVIDGWWTIDKPIRSAPWVWWYGTGLGMLRAVGPFGNVRFQVSPHDTIPAGTDQNRPMIWMAESPVEPAALALDPTLQARIGSSDGTTARRENAYIDVSVTLDCNNVADDGLFTDNIQNSKFECVIRNALNYGVRDYFYGWGNEHLESVIGAGLVGKFLSFAGNGVHVGGKQIWGHPVQPSVAHIICEGDCNGMNIDMGFVEEGVTGVLLRRAVGPINISGIDFEIFSSYAIDIDGSTVSGTRPCGPVTVTNCFLETKGTNAVIRVNNGILNVEGCRIRNTSGASASGLSVFEVIGADSVVTERNNWIQPTIGNRFVSGVQSFSKSGRTHQRHLTQDAGTSLAVIDEQVIRSDPYNRALETMAIRASSIVFNSGTQDVGNRLTLTAQTHLGAATTGTSGIEIDATQGATYGVHPVADNTNQLGRAARQWKTIYLVSAPVVSSDKNLKNVRHETIPDALLDAWPKHVTYGVYSWKDETDGGRLRAGLFAQDIIAAFEEAEIDWRKWAIIEVDENGHYHVVKDEAQAIENAVVRRFMARQM